MCLTSACGTDRSGRVGQGVPPVIPASSKGGHAWGQRSSDGPRNRLRNWKFVAGLRVRQGNRWPRTAGFLSRKSIGEDPDEYRRRGNLQQRNVLPEERCLRDFGCLAVIGNRGHSRWNLPDTRQAGCWLGNAGDADSNRGWRVPSPLRAAADWSALETWWQPRGRRKRIHQSLSGRLSAPVEWKASNLSRKIGSHPDL